ncbi:4Fe-4S dicluster domain-containing protein [Chlorobium phaeobacteroides]|jgi:ferredoxin|uniref:Hydrogenase/sulfur reductase, beta subunit n=1 Tax=Chlorobium phaeobacteroides (strain DSM 266 / SMG 266 / 2430) TaxID=290317 RepID=A1BIE4_CHLPD|nr:4Fe-4S dicluster domain-containing protein [Chlorobium phaeobacteroides]ABL66171.1 hydrogenase/sulfur reductase, beta subunit [Chlorobium phaeobacteroides DSM 266]MBV5327288.1 4Fe-4S dicluster domain-containing protein [Chlorobium sp.]
MIYKVISKAEFIRFIDALVQNNSSFGPRQVDTDSRGNPLYQFKPVTSADEIAFDYTITTSSAKHFFLPFSEELSRFSFNKTDWEQHITYESDPVVLIGLRPCDISALNILDDVLLKGHYPSPYYLAKRKNTFVIGMDHLPLPDCFCKSLAHHTVSTGFNLFCSDIGEKYYLSINSSKAFTYLQEFQTDDPSYEDNCLLTERRNLISNSFKTEIDVTSLPSILDIEFDSAVWEKWGAKCLNCGTCAMVCPTCYCYSLIERFDTDLKGASRNRKLYSCNLIDFAVVAGGHNFRPKNGDRLKYRYYHQHRGFAENGNQQICVGCNRCGRACLAGINPKDVINELRMEKESCMICASQSPGKT